MVEVSCGFFGVGLGFFWVERVVEFGFLFTRRFSFCGVLVRRFVFSFGFGFLEVGVWFAMSLVGSRFCSIR